MNRHYVDYNLIPAPYVAMTDAAKTPSQIAAELEESRKAAQAADAKAYGSMKAPDKPAPREQPYRSPDFDFAYVDRKGHQGEVIPKRPTPSTFKDREQAAFEAWLTSATPSGDAESVHDQWRKSLERLEFLEQEDEPESIITPLAPSAGVVADAPTEWQSGAPPSVGWFNARDDWDRRQDDADNFARYFNGVEWSHWVAECTSLEIRQTWLAHLKEFGGERDVGEIEWRGPRLTGESWPEPQA